MTFTVFGDIIIVGGESLYIYKDRLFNIMLVYNKMFELLKEKGYTATRIKNEKLISQDTLTSIKKGKGGLSHKTIDKICGILECQPNDLMEWIPDKKETD